MTDAGNAGKATLPKVEQALTEMADALRSIAEGAAMVAVHTAELLKMGEAIRDRSQTQHSTVLAFIGGSEGQLLGEVFTALTELAEESCELAQGAFSMALRLGPQRLPATITPWTDQSRQELVRPWSSVLYNAKRTGAVLQKPPIAGLASLVQTKATGGPLWTNRRSQASDATTGHEGVETNAEQLANHVGAVNGMVTALRDEADRLDQLAAFVSEIGLNNRQIRDQAGQIKSLAEKTEGDRERRVQICLDSYYTLDPRILEILYACKDYADFVGIRVRPGVDTKNVDYIGIGADPDVDLGRIIQGFEDRADIAHNALLAANRVELREAIRKRFWLSIDHAKLDEAAVVVLRWYYWIENVKYQLYRDELASGELHPIGMKAMKTHLLWTIGVIFELRERIFTNHQEPIIRDARPLLDDWWQFTPPTTPGDIRWDLAPELWKAHLYTASRIGLKEHLLRSGIEPPDLARVSFGRIDASLFVSWPIEKGGHEYFVFEWPKDLFLCDLLEELMAEQAIVHRSRSDCQVQATRSSGTVITAINEGDAPDHQEATTALRIKRGVTGLEQQTYPPTWGRLGDEPKHELIRTYLSSANLGLKSFAWPPQLPGLSFIIRKDNGNEFVAVFTGIGERKEIARIPVPNDQETRALLEELIKWQRSQLFSNAATRILSTPGQRDVQ